MTARYDRPESLKIAALQHCAWSERRSEVSRKPQT